VTATPGSLIPVIILTKMPIVQVDEMSKRSFGHDNPSTINGTCCSSTSGLIDNVRNKGPKQGPETRGPRGVYVCVTRMANVDLVSQGVGKLGRVIQTRFHWICVVTWRRTEAMSPDFASLSTHAPQPSPSVQV
jgi:hypothetical protein